MSNTRGNCWLNTLPAVPQRRDETDSCPSFVDQLANRESWPFKEAK